LLVDLRNKGITGKEAEDALGRADLTINKNMVPFDTQSPFVTSGIRIGSPAMTTRGMGTDEFSRIAELMDQVITNHTNQSVIEKVRGEVREMCELFPLYDFVIA